MQPPDHPYWLQAWSGVIIDLMAPDPAQIRVSDLVRGLSAAPRFAGHTETRYSVAQHLLHCRAMAYRDQQDPSVQLACLLHDAAEAYLCDLPAPLKALLPEYRKIEARLQSAILQRFDAVFPEHTDVVAYYDDLALRAERKRLLPNAGDWPGVDPAVTPRVEEEAHRLSHLKSRRSKIMTDYQYHIGLLTETAS